jgi:hypothetical protein
MFIALIFHHLTALSSDSHQIAEILRYVSDHEKYLNVTDNNVVIFFGTTQTGKSTTINALRNMRFKISNGELVPEETAPDKYDKMGISTRREVEVTEFPQAWQSPNDDLVFVDTPGAFGLWSDSVTAAGNLILLDMVVYNARSVRFVLVDEYHTILSGAVAYKSVGKVLLRIASNETEVPILFLYNRFIDPPGVEVPANEPERMNFIVERIKICAEQMWKGLKKKKSILYRIRHEI